MSGFSSRVGCAVGLITLLYGPPARGDRPLAASLCPDTGSVVAVSARKRELWLCDEGFPLAKFRVALGRGGVDKHREGDGRTPLGTYALGSPRASIQYGVFIPIEYPTREQAAQGFTGGSVGIHGPPRGLEDVQYYVTSLDWTRGCIATGLDSDIALIADFVRAYQPTLVISDDGGGEAATPAVVASIPPAEPAAPPATSVPDAGGATSAQQP